MLRMGRTLLEVGHSIESSTDSVENRGASICARTRKEEFMASIRKEIRINAPASQIWDALKDVGALHTRLVPGFVTDTKLEGNARVVTFGNGMVAREEIVSIEP